MKTAITLDTKKVMCLYRVSTDRQGTEEDIPLQKNECHRFAKEHGWEIVHETTQKTSGYSVAIEKRSDLIEVKKKAEKGEIDVLLVYMSDRIGRQIELVGLVSALVEMNVEVWSVKEGKIGGEEHIDSLLTFMKFWVAEGESKKTSERVIDGIKQVVDDGLYAGGKPPFGYYIHDTGQKLNSKKQKTLKELRVEETEATIIKEMFHLAHTKGWGSGLIAKYFNEKGIMVRGKVVRHTTVSRTLRNPVYMGYKRFGVTEKRNNKSKNRKLVSREDWQVQQFNPNLVIVDETVFKEVQQMMDNRVCHGEIKTTPKSTKSKYALLSGLVVCGCCGAKLVTNSAIKKRKRKDGSIREDLNVRYRCNPASHKIDHGKRYWGNKAIDKKVEDHVLNVMGSITFDTIDEELQKHKSTFNETLKKDVESITVQIKKKEVALTNAEKEMELFFMGDSDFTKEQIGTMMKKVSKDLVELKLKKSKLMEDMEQQELSLDDIIAFKDKFSTWVDVYHNSDMETKQTMLGSVVKQVVLYDGKVEVHFKLGINEAMNLQDDFMDRMNESSEIIGVDKDCPDLKEGEMWVSHLHNNKWNGNTKTPPLKLSVLDLMKMKTIEFTANITIGA